MRAASFADWEIRSLALAVLEILQQEAPLLFGDFTVEELPEHHRLVFCLRELEGKSYEEIAQITGVNLGTVKSRLHRARHSFAQRIEHLLN